MKNVPCKDKQSGYYFVRGLWDEFMIVILTHRQVYDACIMSTHWIFNVLPCYKSKQTETLSVFFSSTSSFSF